MVPRKPISRADRLGHTVMAGAAEYEIDSGLQTDSMANRNEHWSHCTSCAEHSADDLAAIGERRPGATLNAGFLVRTDEARLGHSY